MGYIPQRHICVYVIYLTTCVCLSVASRLRGFSSLAVCACACSSGCVRYESSQGVFSGLEAPKIFGLRFGDESHHRKSSTVLSGGLCEAESDRTSGSPMCLLKMLDQDLTDQMMDP